MSLRPELEAKRAKIAELKRLKEEKERRAKALRERQAAAEVRGLM